MRKIIMVLGFVITSTAAFGATELAKVNSKVITLEEFNAKYQEQMKFFRSKAPTKKNILDEIIKRDLGIQEAKRLGLDKDPAVIDRINTVLYHSLLDKELGPKFAGIKLSDSEVSSYYSKNPEIRTSHIFVQVRFDATQAQEKAAYEKIKKIKQYLDEGLKSGKKTFAEIARSYSEGVAAAAGGDIDYQTKDKLDPAYYDAAIKLGKGDNSGIIRSQFGYHIVRMTGKKDFKEVDQGEVKRRLFDEKKEQIFETYMAQLKSKAQVSVNSKLIEQETATE